MAVSGMLAQRLAFGSGRDATFADERVDPVSPYTDALREWSSGVKKRYEDRLAEVELNDDSIFEAAKNASLRDLAEIEQEILNIRDWDKEQIKSGAALDQSKWSEYRSKRRDMITNLRLKAERSAASEQFYKDAITQAGQMKYAKPDEVRARIKAEMEKPLADRRVSRAITEMATDPSMYDIDQYLTDRVAQEAENMTQQAYSQTQGRHIMDYEVKYMKPFFRWDPDTKQLSYEINPQWAETVLNSSPAWFNNAVDLGVQDKESRIRELSAKQDAGEITPDELIELTKSVPFLTMDSRSKRIAVLGEMMNSKARSEVNLVSKTMSAGSTGITAAERKLAMEQRFLNARVDGFMNGNYDVIVNEMNTGGSQSVKGFSWQPGPDGTVRITYQRKEPKRPGSSKEQWKQYTMDIDPDDEQDIRDNLAALYRIKTEEVSDRPSEVPMSEDERVISRLPEFEAEQYQFNLRQIDFLQKKLRGTTDKKQAAEYQKRIEMYQSKNSQMAKQASSGSGRAPAGGTKKNPFERR